MSVNYLTAQIQGRRLYQQLKLVWSFHRSFYFKYVVFMAVWLSTFILKVTLDHAATESPYFDSSQYFKSFTLLANFVPCYFAISYFRALGFSGRSIYRNFYMLLPVSLFEKFLTALIFCVVNFWLALLLIKILAFGLVIVEYVFLNHFVLQGNAISLEEFITSSSNYFLNYGQTLKFSAATIKELVFAKITLPLLVLTMAFFTRQHIFSRFLVALVLYYGLLFAFSYIAGIIFSGFSTSFLEIINAFFNTLTLRNTYYSAISKINFGLEFLGLLFLLVAVFYCFKEEESI